MFEYVVYICNFNQNLSLQFLSFRKTHRRAGLYHLTHSAPLPFLSQSPRCAQLGSHLHISGDGRDVALVLTRTACGCAL